MVTLFDVNLLVALAWPNHVHHAAAIRWFLTDAQRAWATTLLTETGFVRVSSNPRILNEPATPHAALSLLAQWQTRAQHQFWSSDHGLVELDDDLRDRLAGHRQVTDAALVAVARHHDGLVATFDRGLHELDPERVELLDA